MITIRFASHPGIFNWACRFAQYGFWATHCEAVLPDGRHIGSWFLKGGVKIEPADYDAGEFTRELIVSIKATTEQEAKFYDFLRSQVDKPYDWVAIVGFYSSGRDWQEPDSWFCAEYIGAALAACGLLPQHMAFEFSRLSVRDLMLLASTITEVG